MYDFDWETLMEMDNSTPVPEELFTHVEESLFNGIKKGMLLEVAHKNNPDIYWLAEITMVCGHVLRIKYIGSDSDFWCDLTKTKVHPLGWCGKYDELIEPTEEIHKKYGDNIIEIMKKALIDGVSVSIEALNNSGLSPIDRISSGMKVEVQCSLDPFRYWIATINENIGGRLLLRYDGANEDINDMWIFYTNTRLSNYGFVTSKGSPWYFKYPGKVNKFSCKNKLSAQLKSCAEDAIKNPTPADLFQPEFDLNVHTVSVGMKMEALDPRTMAIIKPATVVKIFNSYQFLVVPDDNLGDYEFTDQGWVGHTAHPYIFPIGWASKNKVPFDPPSSWNASKPFDWREYANNAAAPLALEKQFEKRKAVQHIMPGMKLEAVNPETQQIFAAAVDRIVEDIICVELLSTEKKVWYWHKSENIFPTGWCSSNNHDLVTPDIQAIKAKRSKMLETKSIQSNMADDKWCDRLYFNYKCYSGPAISRNKLSQLPKHVGPGPLALVIKEVLNMIISVAYKPAKMLRDWECDESATLAEGMRLEILKAKLKLSTHHAPVAVPKIASKVPVFCQEMCAKLQCCPHLFGPLEFPEQCPERCQQVDKSKFHTPCTVERRGRPKGSKKKKKIPPKPEQSVEVNKETASCNESDNGSSGHQTESRPNTPESGNDTKGGTRKKRHQLPKLEMKTRGAKIPNNAQQSKKGQWSKKDVDTIYSNSYVLPKKNSHSDSDNSNSFRSFNKDELSDVSDDEEPELKKLRFNYSNHTNDYKSFQKYVKRVKSSPVSWTERKQCNPLKWSVEDVYDYFIETEDCNVLADRLKEEEIDGAALTLLDVPTLEEFLHLRPRYAVLLCNHINKIKALVMTSDR